MQTKRVLQTLLNEGDDEFETPQTHHQTEILITEESKIPEDEAAAQAVQKVPSTA